MNCVHVQDDVVAVRKREKAHLAAKAKVASTEAYILHLGELMTIAENERAEAVIAANRKDVVLKAYMQNLAQSRIKCGRCERDVIAKKRKLFNKQDEIIKFMKGAEEGVAESEPEKAKEANPSESDEEDGSTEVRLAHLSEVCLTRVCRAMAIRMKTTKTTKTTKKSMLKARSNKHRTCLFHLFHAR